MTSKRREFFKLVASGLAALTFPKSSNARRANPGTSVGNAREVPSYASNKPNEYSGDVLEHFDVIVVGGGIAGVSAAISAARNGVNVALVHERSMLGGNSSSEVRLFPENNSGHHPWIKEGGLHEEFHTEERVRNHEEYREGMMNCHWDLVLYGWVLREPNLTLFLDTHMHRVTMSHENHIDSIYCIQLGTEKAYRLSSPLFVDATGDGVLAYRSGAAYRWGRESHSEYGEPLAPDIADEKVMGNTLFFRAVDAGRPVPFKRPDWAAEFPNESDLVDRNHDFIGAGYWWIEIGAPLHPIRDNQAIKHETLRQVLGVWDHIKNKGAHGAENYALEFVGFWPYKRECRRILGDFVLTQQHIQDPQTLEDAVAYGAWGIDIHNQRGILMDHNPPYPPPRSDENLDERHSQVYTIPLRSLYSRNIDNLMMAGRPISASYLAFASSRTLSTGSIVGQAVGVAVALCKHYGVTPRIVAKAHAKECQQLILRQGGHIPGVVNEDTNDLAKRARVTASSEARLIFPKGAEWEELDQPLAQLFPVSARMIQSVMLRLKSTLDQPAEVTLGLRKAAHVWDFRSNNDLALAKMAVAPSARDWVRFDLNATIEPNRLYYVYCLPQPGVFWERYKEDDTSLAARCPVGTAAASQPGKLRWRVFTQAHSLALRVEPESWPYSPGNVVRGTNRPDTWTNIWISDPEVKLPAWLELRWPAPVIFNTIEITFYTNANRRSIEPLFRYTECINDYKIEVWTGLDWQCIAEIRDNYVRRRVHSFDDFITDRVRLLVLATNGVVPARVYEIRIYHQV